ncbi:apolipoprotein N-acyltransferase [Erythrobacter sp. NE805]|uniref:apolipoprotein N-acyltransferase n=1 Tax=Erythrobacter sp. NE805 TaxID=3389875 RepID=UPI00396B467B
MTGRLSALAALAQARPGLAAILLGLLGACAYPPLHLWPLGLAALAGFVWLAHDAASWRSAAWRGWLFGWAHLTLANNWIATAFTHQAKMPEALGWAAVPLLCLYLAVYPMLAALAAHGLARRQPLWAFGLVLAGAWTVTEWLRGWVFTGYPWPPVSLMLVGGWGTPGAARVLPWIGTYALSGLTLLVSALLLASLAARRWLAAAGGAAVLGALMLAPSLAIEVTRPANALNYTLVQPLIPQAEINDPAKFEEQFARLTRLTAPGRDTSRIVLWPESALPDYLEDGYPDGYYAAMTAGGDPAYARARIARVIGPRSTLVTGVVNLNFTDRPGRSPALVSARNSVMAIGGKGTILAGYDKAHLVPYGEYLPLRPLLEPLGLSRLVAGSIEYVPGPGPRTLGLGEHGKVGVQICYEIVFSGEVVDPANRPDFIFNPSNDGWFGAWGSPQFVGQARMRAIEEGLPVLRSTTTGISAVIDADGVVRQAIARGKADAVAGIMPPAAAPTLFARLGHILTLGWAALFAVLGLALPRVLALARARR